MQFPNCIAKVRIFSISASEQHIYRMLYNIVLEKEQRVYTSKQSKTHNVSKGQAINVMKHIDGPLPLNTFKQNDRFPEEPVPYFLASAM